jgi:hypothetical protein
MAGFDDARPVAPPAHVRVDAPPPAAQAANGGAGNVPYRVYGPVEGDPPCPVIPLGKAGDVLHVLSPGGEMLTLNPKSNAMAFVNLFDGNTQWLIQHFRKLDKDANPVQDFVLRNAYAWFVARCRVAGIWDASTRICGVGVWRGPVVDGVAVPLAHCGDAIFEAPRALQAPLEPGARGKDDGQGEWHEPGYRAGKAIFVARPAMVRPDVDSPATADDGRRMLAALGLWAWERPEDPSLCAGWFAAALLGGYPSWRVHAQIAAEFGSGKSTLLKLLVAALGALAREFNDVTEAGARSALANEGRVLVLDEAENEGGPDGKVARLIGLLRRMAGDDGAAVGRGSPGQTFYEAHVSGCALMAAILPPALQPADRSRIWRGQIRKATGDHAVLARVRAETAWAGTMSARFRARMLLRWRQYHETQAIYRERLMTADGYMADGRQADLLSVLLAGLDVLTRDTLPIRDEQDEAMELVRHLLSLMREADSESSTAGLCWNYLLSWDTPDRRGGEVQNIGNMLAFALGDEGPDGSNGMTLRRFGLRLEEVKYDHIADPRQRWDGFEQGDMWLLVANQHGGLSRIFGAGRGQRWGDGNWSLSLAQLDGSRKWPVPEQFAGVKSRAIAIPMRICKVLTEHAPMARNPAPQTGGEHGSHGGLWP